MYPRFTDIDHDSDFDLFMGHSYGTGYDNYIVFWRNNGSPQVANFYMDDTLFLFPAGTLVGPRPCLADIDDDGDDDMFVGEAGGAMLFYRNMEFNSVNPLREMTAYSFSLHQNYPNPFNASTTIPFTLDRAVPVKVVVYNQLGQEVWSSVNGHQSSGYHEVVWNAEGVASGVYLVALEAGSNFGQARKVMLVK